MVSSRLCSSPGAHGFDAVAEDLLGATLGVEALKRAGAMYKARRCHVHTSTLVCRRIDAEPVTLSTATPLRDAYFQKDKPTKNLSF